MCCVGHYAVAYCTAGVTSVPTCSDLSWYIINLLSVTHEPLCSVTDASCSTSHQYPHLTFTHLQSLFGGSWATNKVISSRQDSVSGLKRAKVPKGLFYVGPSTPINSQCASGSWSFTFIVARLQNWVNS